MIRRPPRSTLFPTRRSSDLRRRLTVEHRVEQHLERHRLEQPAQRRQQRQEQRPKDPRQVRAEVGEATEEKRSEEHTSELQSRQYLVCRLLLEKKKEDSERER